MPRFAQANGRSEAPKVLASILNGVPYAQLDVWSSMARPPSIRQTFYYKVSPERVYRALTEPSELVKWFPDRAQISLKPGGRFYLTWKAGFTMRGKVKAVKPPTELRVTWIDRIPGVSTFETEARFKLVGKGKGTLLTVHHSGFESGQRWISLYGAVQSGWAYYLTNLRSVLEHKIDLRTSNDSLV